MVMIVKGNAYYLRVHHLFSPRVLSLVLLSLVAYNTQSYIVGIALKMVGFCHYEFIECNLQVAKDVYLGALDELVCQYLVPVDNSISVLMDVRG